ncbi:MAG: hypothetical protein RRB22_10415 [Gammaproteobacteria bacterium]|nr:hypothetical protein [Gammaproteobacteria bacterium]
MNHRSWGNTGSGPLRALLISILLLLAGCAGAPSVTVDAAEAQQQFSGKSVAQALEETEAAMTRARQMELAFYSPGFFAQASKALEEARFLVLAPKQPGPDGQAPEAEIFAKLLLTNKALEQATAIRAEVQTRLQDILSVRDSLLAKGIDRSAAADYNDLMNGLSDLFRRLEKNEQDGFARAQAVTLRQFQRLESQSVKAVQLEEGISILQKAEAIGAGGAAPRSHQKTRQALKQAQATIERDPNDQVAIQTAVERFVFEARHLLHATEEVKELRVLNHAAMENILLAAESHLLAISDALQQPDLRQHSLRDQTALITSAVEKLIAAKTPEKQTRPRPVNKNELEAAQLRLAQLQAQLSELQTQNVQLQRAEKPLQKRIDALERVVIKLNAERAALELELAKATPPAEGVEITPIVRP